jgi:hypothetical protein
MELIRVYSKNFPLPGYLALTFYPWVFIREGVKDRYTAKVDRHECTHAYQQIETLWILFLVIYGLEWLIKWLCCGFDSHRAYKSISFEQEAYDHEDEIYYNDVRSHYNWIKYIFKLVKA